MTVPCIVAIDPGAHGAVAFLTDGGALLDVLDMPSVEVKIGGTKRTRVSEQALALLIAANAPLHAFIEDVQPMAKNGGIGSFHLGMAAGMARGALAALAIPTTLCGPAKWKRAMGLTADKGLSRQRAMQLFPARADLFARVKDADRAEAVLIGLYGLRTWRREMAQHGRDAT